MKILVYDDLLKKDAEFVLKNAPKDAEENLSGLLPLHKGCGAIAYILGTPVGVVCSDAAPISPRASVSLFVLPQYRRRGVGSALLSFALNASFLLGTEQILFEFWKSDTASRFFAEKNGFSYAFSSQYMKYDGDTPAFCDVFEEYEDAMYPEYQRLEAEAFYPLRKKIGQRPALMLPSEYVRDFMRRNASNIFVLRESGQIVAGVNVDGTTIEDVFVNEPYRGRGLGRLLIYKGIAVARRKGRLPVYLWVVGENEIAAALYASIGFHTEKTKLFYRISASEFNTNLQ